MNSTLYVEPQAELSYGLVKGDDYSVMNDVFVEQDDAHSLIGRIGARFGASFLENRGTVFATASLHHDFLGRLDNYAYAPSSLYKNSQSFMDDFGGTWFTYGIGTQFNTTENLNFYGTLEHSSGAKFKQNYKYSVGMRYIF